MPSEGGTIRVTSGVSAFTGQGFVDLRWGAQAGQLSPEEARQHALAVLGAAEAAELDALVYAELTSAVGVNDGAAAAFLLRLRERRGQ
jgi:hypothetical protein